MRAIQLAAVAVVLTSAPAFALPIAVGSSISITGSDTATTAVSINMATGLDFASVALSLDLNLETGSFAGLFAPGLAGTIKSINSFQPFNPITGFYAFTQAGQTLSFDLGTVTVTNRSASIGGSIPSLTITGTGAFHLTGFDDTSALFTLTTQGSTVTTFAATTSVASDRAVPEPASLALLGAGLVGIGLVRRRQMVR